mgnify:CR=1 FL=1|jgi:1-acyl-sn-glycerol-3-phosphate acyltransferase
MHKLFIDLYYFIKKNKIFAFAIALVFLLSCGFFASKIHFEEDITRIIPKSDKSDVTAKVLQQLNFSDKVTVIIEKGHEGSLDDLSEMATVFLDSITSCNQYIKTIQGKVNEENIQETFDFVYQNLPLFLEDKDYLQIQNKLNKDSIAQQVQSNYRTLISPTGIVAKDFILNDPLGISFIALKKLQQLSVGDEFKLHNGFVVTKDDTKLLLFINPILSGSETEKNALFVNELNRIKTDLNNNFKRKSSIDYFGSSLIAVANANQIKHDIITTIAVSMSALMLILILFYRKIIIPIIIFIPTIFGVLFALASLYFLKDAISAISLSVGAVLLGITIDYSLHILTHYKHNSDINALYKDITKPLIMSSTTTAVAFLCLLFVNSEALKDLGVFAAISVLVSALFSLIIIPHLYQPKDNDSASKETILDKTAGFSFHNNKILIVASLLIIIISFFTFSKVSFNNNLSDLNFVPKDIKAAEAKLESATNLTSKSIYLASYGNSMEEVLEKNNTLFNNLNTYKKEGEILNFSSIGGVVLSNESQVKKIEKWNSFWTASNKNFVQSNLIEYGNAIGFKPSTHDNFYNLLNINFKPISFQDYANVKAFFLDEFVSSKNGFFTVSSVVKVSKEQRDAFVQYISTKKDVVAIDRQHINETFLGKLKDDFNSLVNYSIIAVMLILFLFFRKIELVAISMIPILITGVVTMGIMGVFGIQLNIFSTIVCTLIFGHGVDFSIFMTSALQKECTYGKSELATYRTSILLAVITTILAIGALIFAEHPALKSISSVSLIGVFSALLITFIFYPILFKICISNRPKKGKSPVTFRMFVHSTLSFIYYGLGGFILSLIGQFVISVVPINKKDKMLWFRRTMSKFMKSVFYTNPFASIGVVNLNNEQFEKPAILIANHTSFLDILGIGMLSPKIIFVVNDWVYNSPFFGRGVKLAGFYPVSQGIDGGVEHLRAKVEEGYSIIVFPEGTRSSDNSIKRFHKGAFYMAEQFNIDVLPIYIHGNSELLPKGDNIIYDETLTVVIGDRILPSNTEFGTDYSTRTKKISTFYKKEFSILRRQLEDENYFKNKFYLSFLYKEQEIIDTIKKDFNLNKANYLQLSQLVLPETKILHLADNFGQIDVLLALYHPLIKIESFIEDEEKRGVASTNYIVNIRKIKYLQKLSDAKIDFDTVIISSSNITIENLESLKTAKTVILMNSFELENEIISYGFSVENKEKTILVLKK